MHPIVLSEFYQSRRGLPWQLLLFFLSSAGLQFLFGPIAILLLLSPMLATAVGVATLAEEYGKGQMRFLYSLPISPRGLWSVKVLSGIVGTGLFVGVVLLPAVFIRRPMVPVAALDQLGFGLSNLVVVLVGQAIVAYAAGLFTVTFCQVVGTAIMLAGLIASLPPLLYGLVVALRGFVIPGPMDVGFGLALSSLPLWIGAYVLFRRRNPFFDQPWRWRGLAALFVGFYGMATIAVAAALTFRPFELTDPYHDGVVYFCVLPGGSEVLVLGGRSLFDEEAYVLDASGRLVRDLFRMERADVRPPAQSELNDSRAMLCRQWDIGMLRTDRQEHCFVLDLDTGARTPVSLRDASDDKAHYYYRRLSDDRRTVLGFKTAVRKGGKSYAAFWQVVLTSEYHEISIFDGQGYPDCYYLDDDRVLVAELSADKANERKLTVVELRSGVRTVRRLPDEVHQSYLAPDGRSCAVLQWRINGDTIRQELSLLDVISGRWKTLISSEELPRLKVHDALTHQELPASVYYPDRQSANWLVCTLYDAGSVTASWLIDGRTLDRFKLPESAAGSSNQIGAFSQDKSRFFIFSWSGKDSKADRGGKQLFLDIYKFKNSGIETVNSFEWDALFPAPAWVGNDRLLYRKIKPGPLSNRGELWTLDVNSGQQHPFFTAIDRPAAP